MKIKRAKFILVKVLGTTLNQFVKKRITYTSVLLRFFAHISFSVSLICNYKLDN